MIKELSHVMLNLRNVTIVKCEKKNKGTTKCNKRIVICDVRTAQYEDRTVKCEKKVREPPNVRKELLYVMLELHNVKMKL